MVDDLGRHGSEHERRDLAVASRPDDATICSSTSGATAVPAAAHGAPSMTTGGSATPTIRTVEPVGQ
jgi:hypothetical protein